VVFGWLGMAAAVRIGMQASLVVEAKVDMLRPTATRHACMPT
jgi:hypothetical protein